MEEQMEISESKNYHTFGVYLGRKKISNGHKLARLLIQKFALSKKSKDWQPISFDELKEKGILPCKKHKTYAHWREEMLRSGLLICMATKDELKDETPNYKANMFKIGAKAEKYIDIAIQENLPKKVDEIGLKVDEIGQKYEDLNERMDSKADNQRVDRLESEVKALKENVNNLTSIVLEAFPPDTPVRRKIVQDNINNKEECIRKLAKEIENNIKENGHMFN